MTDYQFTSTNSSETLNFAKKIAPFLEKGSILVLTGDLGAGKTKFTEGILTYFGLQDEISSPTFTIVNEYHPKDISIFHFDVYRLTDSSEFTEIGGEEYFEKGICLMEWGETILEVLPPHYLQIQFEKGKEENTRILTLHALGEKYEKILNQL